MTTHTTLSAAREAAANIANARCIVEIDHAVAGRCYIVAMAPMANLATIKRNNPAALAEITAFVSEHEVLTADQIQAQREQALRDNTRCERCGCHVDGNTAYSQTEWYRGHKVTAHYCAACHTLLSAVGAGEHTALQERAAEQIGHEPETKEDY